MYIKYRILFLTLLGIVVWNGAEAQENRAKADTIDDEEIIKLTEVRKDWRKVYSERSLFLFDRALMGEVPGVYSAANGFSGNVGLLMLRGITSVNLNTSPYVVVDGMPVRQNRNISPFASGISPSNMPFINPLDIADIRILNNGYDNVFYGGRSGNGIVEVEIDKGSLGAATIDLSVKFGILDADYHTDVMNASQYRSYLYAMMENKGMTASELQNNSLFNPNFPLYNFDTDWQGLLNRKGIFSDYHLKMKGGDGDTRYLFSVGYTSEGNVMKEVKDSRFNMRFNLDFKITPKIEMSSFFTYNYGSSRFYGQGSEWIHNPVYLAAVKAPFMSPDYYTEDGILVDRLADKDVLGMTNPAVLWENLENKGMNNRIDALLRGRYALNAKTAVNAELMISYNSLVEKLHQKAYGIAPDRYIERQNSKRTYSEYLMRWRFWADRTGNIAEGLTYHAHAGFSMDTYKEKMIYGRKVNAASDEVESVGGGKLADSIGNTIYDHNLMNFYLSGGLSWQERLLLNVSSNLERSSNFGPNGKWNVYAGAELRWIAMLTNRERLEISAQYGRTGNHELRGGYYARLYKPVSYYQYGGIYLGNVRNDDLKPEYTHNYDAGMKLMLFGNRLEAGATWYYRKTVGMITQKALPIELGLDPQYENSGDVENKGWEFSLAITPIQREHFSWSIFGTLSTLQNKVLRLRNGEVVRSMDGFTGVAREGEEVGAFYGYKVKGIFRNAGEVNLLKTDGTPYEAGDYIMEDLNGDKRIDSKDRQVLGSPVPDFFGGFGTRLSYRGLSFSALFTYSYGNEVYNLFRQKMSSMSGYENQHPDVVDRWVSPDHLGTGWLPRAAYGDPSGNFATSDRWVEDGSYLKLKSVAVKYDIPMNDRTGFIKGITLSVNCNNLFTVSGYSGFDPEVFSEVDPLLRGVDCGATPSPRSYIFGLNVAF